MDFADVLFNSFSSTENMTIKMVMCLKCLITLRCKLSHVRNCSTELLWIITFSHFCQFSCTADGHKCKSVLRPAPELDFSPSDSPNFSKFLQDFTCTVNNLHEITSFSTQLLPCCHTLSCWICCIYSFRRFFILVDFISPVTQSSLNR